MDSGVADFSNGFSTIRVIKDRSQWMLEGVRINWNRSDFGERSTTRRSFELHC